jgi:diphthamide synthase (EF-2-diphthine--ammonia ligase)
VASAVGEGITHIIFGDLFPEDIKAYREQKLAGTGITPLFPLWMRPTLPLAHAMIASGMEAYLATVDRKKLSAEFAGRKFDMQLLDDLPAGVTRAARTVSFTPAWWRPSFRAGFPRLRRARDRTVMAIAIW